MQLAILMKRLGFGKNAHKVYGALTKSRVPLSVANLARTAHIDRPEVYRNLTTLLQHALIKKERVGKRLHYVAEHPNRLLHMFQQTTKDVVALTTKLLQQQKQNLPKEIRYFTGFSGIRAVFDDVIEKTPRSDTFYRYTSECDLTLVNRYLSADYRANRDRKKLERLVISNPVSGKQKRSRLERFIKYIPEDVDLFEYNIIELIYGEYLALINLNTETAIIIHDKTLAAFQKVIFKQLYKKLS